MSRPPRLTGALLRRLLPREIADALVGDLEEGFHARVARGGPVRAHLWYWGQVVRLPHGALGQAVDGLRRARSRRVRDMTRGRGSMGRFGEELRVALRGVTRRPGFSLVVIGTLATSIGAATLIFSALEAVLARTLPYPDGDRVVSLYTLNEAWRDSGSEQLREMWNHYPVAPDQIEATLRVPGVVAAGGAANQDAIVRVGTDSRRIGRATVTTGLFETLGVEPLAGRLPTDGELTSGAPVLLVSHRFWTEELGQDPAAVGRTVSVDGTLRTVIGIMPAGFWFPSPEQEIWDAAPAAFYSELRSQPVLLAVARLAEGVSIPDVNTAVDAASRALADTDPGRAGLGMRAVSRRDETLGDVRQGMLLFMGAVALVVLLASVNLANLVLARTSRRRSELAVRRALGGGRLAVTWTVLAEVVILCLVGGGLGVLAAATLLRPFMGGLAAAGIWRGVDAHMNLTVVTLAVATTVLAAVAAGLPVAWRASRSAPAATLRDVGRGGSSRSTRRVQRGLLVAESGLAFVLLVGAVLLVRSVAALASVDAGYDPRGLDFIELSPSAERYPTAEARLGLYRSVAQEVARTTGAPVALVNPLPSSGSSGVETIRAVDAEEGTEVTVSQVGEGFFEVIGMPLRRGRAFTAQDGPDDPPVVVVDELLARRMAPEGDALGREVVLGRGDDERRATVVGVVGAARVLAVALPAQQQLYLPLGQSSPSMASVLVREREARAAGLREAALAVDADLGLGRIGTLQGMSWQLMAPVRVRAVLLGALAVLALLLAAVGVSAVVAHVVEERTREIGVRIALGAMPAGESLRVTRSFLATVGGGTLVGLAVSMAAARLLTSFLYEVNPLDPWSYAAAVVGLTVLGTVAAWIPARRAASVDPIQVLNRE